MSGTVNMGHDLSENFGIIQISTLSNNVIATKVECGKKVDSVLLRSSLLEIRSLLAIELENDMEERDGTGGSILTTLSRLLTKIATKNPERNFPHTVLSGNSSLLGMLAYGSERRGLIKNNPELILQILDIQPEYFRKERIGFRVQGLDAHEDDIVTNDPHLNFACDFFRGKAIRVAGGVRPEHFRVVNGIIKPSPEGLLLLGIPDIVQQIQELYDDHKNGLS